MAEYRRQSMEYQEPLDPAVPPDEWAANQEFEQCEARYYHDGRTCVREKGHPGEHCDKPFTALNFPYNHRWWTDSECR